MQDEHSTTLELTEGQRITATTYGRRAGHDVFTERQFTISHDQTVEPFIRRDGHLSQDRIFVVDDTYRSGPISAPALVVSGSIKSSESE